MAGAITSTVEDRFFLTGMILLLAVVAAVVARRLSVPVLVLFLGLGMLLGSDGPGGIYFDDANLARTIGIIGLVAILFEGGLSSDWRDVRPVVLPAFLLGTVGVFVTALIVGLAAHSLFDLSWSGAFLLGAIVGSTDAAAVFAALRFSAVRRRIANLLAAESGLNDPMAVALTLGLISLVTSHSYGLADVAVLLVRQLGLGLVVGLGLGFIASRVFPRLPADLPSVAPVASVAAAALAYGIAETLHASGFLSVYIVALWVGNTPMPHRRAIIGFHQGLAFLAEVALFIVLGLLVFPSRLGAVAAASLGLTAVLLLARPLAVFISTLFQGFGWRERTFVSWAGLRGAVPIVLATFALSRGVHASATIFNAVFFVVLLSALLQGLSLDPLARRLNLASERRPAFELPIEVGAVRELGADIVEHQVAPGDAVVGRPVRETGLPRSAIVMLIVRDGVGIPPRGSTLIEAGDRLYVMASGKSRPAIEELLDRWQEGPLPIAGLLPAVDRGQEALADGHDR
jgi:cell volume regulation protein A